MNFTEFVDNFLKFHDQYKDYSEPLFKSIDHLKITRNAGLCLEFGVFNGYTISHINERLPNWNIYGFDSFEGLPEKWERSDDPRYLKGHFTLEGKMPNLHPNIKLIKGWFEDTLPTWCENHQKYSQIDLLHVDCDIYSSTKTIFTFCESFIKKDTIIVFDELLGYSDFEKHEMKAFYEFIQYSNLKFDILYSGGYNLEKAAVVIT